MKVLLVAAATSTTGGGERHVADVLRRAPRTGAVVELCCPPGGDLTSLALELGIRVHHAAIETGFSPAAVRSVRAAIDAAGADLVHAHGSRAAFFARLADPQARSWVVYTVHGIHVDKAGSSQRRAVLLGLERFLRRRTLRFLCVCESDVAKGAALGVLDPARTSVLYNGIEPAGSHGAGARGVFRAELSLGADALLALSVGRFHEQKDQRTLLDAWGRVLAHGWDTEGLSAPVLALVGSGPLESALRVRAAELGLGDSVRFVSPRAGLGAAYADADVFVLSSLWEGLPYVVLEAMDAGLAVVSTAVDGIPEAVVDGEAGLLVPPADPAALADAVVSLLADPERARAMGEAGRARVEREFTLERMLAAYAELYAELLAG